jgi:phosphatidylglycerol:prolipoprotein diacylglycerol transferase
MTLYGGIILSILAVWIYVRRQGISFLDVADCVAPSLAIGIAIGRVGCFLRGCCFGLPTDSALGIHFPRGSEASVQGRQILMEQGHHFSDIPASPALHPAQLYSAFGALVIFMAILVIEKAFKFRGAMFAELLVLYGIHRILMDQFRFYDTASSGFWGLTVSQWVSVGFIIAGAFMWIRTLRTRVAVA